MSEIATLRAELADSLSRVLPMIQKDRERLPTPGRLKVLAVQTSRRFVPEDVAADPAEFSGNDLRLLLFWQALHNHGMDTEVVNEGAAGWTDPEPEFEGVGFRRLWAQIPQHRAVLYVKKS